MKQKSYYTAKYAATNGALLWEKRYNGPANGNEYILARSLALGPNEMVAMTGLSDGTFNDLTAPDCATILYREILPPVSIAADGAGGYFIRGQRHCQFHPPIAARHHRDRPLDVQRHDDGRLARSSNSTTPTRRPAKPFIARGSPRV